MEKELAIKLKRYYLVLQKRKMKTYTFRIDEKDLANLKKAAEKRGRSTGNLIRMIIKTFLTDNDYWQSEKGEK